MPNFVFATDGDINDPDAGFLRGELLVKVRIPQVFS
jgi:hypothetical protein